MEQHFNPAARSYASLSVKDLLEARDAYHVHLCHLDNVFATAIGRYLIRDTDPDHKEYVSTKKLIEKRGTLGARTLEHSSTKPWSWPCVLVFVRHWQIPDEQRREQGHIVPPFLYLPDGRVIPVCVVQASLGDGARRSVSDVHYTSHIMGGGYPVLTQVQGQSRLGSAGCLVTDGRRYYALTNQHVAGRPGDEISSMIGGKLTRIGVAAERSLDKVPFSKAYPGLAGTHTFANLDAGLIEVDDAGEWTAQIYGLGVLGAMVPFDESTATLDWIDCKTVAHGAASGPLRGEIKALFYRYRTVGGTDYVSDFLIGGRDQDPLPTLPGDSGTLWCVDPIMFATGDDDRHPERTAAPAAERHHLRDAERNGDGDAALIESLLTRPDTRFRPIAVQWGGQRLSSGTSETTTQFALASSLAVICRELDLDVVTDINAELPEYWGAVGHYKIAEIAIARVQDPTLAAFMRANLKRITYDESMLTSMAGIVDDPRQFIPLADVPDLVWKNNINKTTDAARSQENWTHYADIDLPGTDGRTLSDISGDPPRLAIQDWIDFYKNLAAAQHKRINNGALPFRVWQIFDKMVEFATKKQETNFLCAAGILSHYIGDACQPLHGSMHSDGLNGAATGVHSLYEEKMVDVHATEIRTGLSAFDFATLGALPASPQNGHQAGGACLELMRRSALRLPPTEICRVHQENGGGQKASAREALWNEFKDETMACLADGARTLAALWDAAYALGQSPAFAGLVKRDSLKKAYEKQTFLESKHLANLDPKDYSVT